jgi:hypothetical protein
MIKLRRFGREIPNAYNLVGITEVKEVLVSWYSSVYARIILKCILLERVDWIKVT